MTMMKKISAMAMVAVMAATMAVGTAMSASAEELDTSVQEEILAQDVTLSSTTIDWGNRSLNTEYNLTDVILYKTDFSDVSMSNGSVFSATISFDGTNYTITVNFQPVTRSVTVGSLTLVNATAVVTGVQASGYNGAALSTSFSPNSTGYSTAEITIPATTSVSSIPAFSYTSDGFTYDADPEYGITLDFETSFDKSYLNLIPAMTQPSAEMTFSIAE